MAEPQEVIPGIFAEVIQYVKAAEKLLAIGGVVLFAADQLSELAQARPDIAPEIVAALTSLNTAHEALGRAHTAVDSINDRRVAELAATITYEGGPS